MGGNVSGCCCQDHKEDASLAMVDAMPMIDSTKDQVLNEPILEPPPKAADVQEEAPSKDADSGDTYLVNITRNDQRLGMMIYSEVGDDYVYVRNVKDGLLVDQWNTANPNKPLKPGNVIVEVNGKRTPEDMRGELINTNTNILQILVKRK
mmetsp:Transcript_18722/g.33876  ORF Transcript_18722/g.33876 Transcript_18722/m.33876 type:complete len:150 (+) Transcript_18722:44-493(+)